MKRKMIAMMMTMVMVLSVFAGCGSGESSGGSDDKSLNILIWEGTWSEEAIKKFEKDNDVKVNISYIDNTDTIISKLVAGDAEFDVIDIEAAYVKSFVENDLLQKIDSDKLTNKKDLKEEFLVGAEGDEDEKYTCPNMGPGYTGIIYNKETCPIEIKEFKDLADPALKGQIAMVNSTISLYGAALAALGYEPNSTDEKEIEEANELLKEIKKNVKAFVGESAVSQLENGECSVALSWDYITLCNDSKENWEKFAIADIPSGCERFVQYWGVTASSEKKEVAEKFIDYMISPEVLAQDYTELGSIIPMLKDEVMKEYLPEEYYENPAVAAYDKLFDKSWMVAVSDDQISLMDTYYTELMGE